MDVINTNQDNVMAEAMTENIHGADVWIGRFKEFYRDLKASEWAELDQLYSSDIYFCDPVHHIQGREALHRYLQSLCVNLTSCRFVYLDQLLGNDSAYIKWEMHFQHPKLRGNATISVRGTSHIKFGGAGIFFHEDFYDMGSMLYENIPLIGSVIAWLRRRLAR